MPRSPCGVGIPGLYPNTVRFFERTALLCEISRGCPANGRPRFLCQILQHYGLLFGGAFIIATAGKSKELEINGQIRDREVRLIGADGEQEMQNPDKNHNNKHQETLSPFYDCRDSRIYHLL